MTVAADYSGVIADLESRRDALTRLIDALRPFVSAARVWDAELEDGPAGLSGAAQTPIRRQLDAIQTPSSTVSDVVPQPDLAHAVARLGPPLGPRPTQQRTVRASPSVDPIITARDQAVLNTLRRLGGVGRGAEIKKGFPREDGQSEESQDAAYRNSMTRLRVRGEIARTGDTWSFVGIGAARA